MLILISIIKYKHIIIIIKNKFYLPDFTAPYIEPPKKPAYAFAVNLFCHPSSPPIFYYSIIISIIKCDNYKLYKIIIKYVNSIINNFILLLIILQFFYYN